MLAYDLYLNGDRSECIFMDRYRDSDAAMEHAANLGLDFADVRAVMHDAGPALIGLGRGARPGGGRPRGAELPAPKGLRVTPPLT